jgi:6-phosphogluconate dehydrogenase
VIHDQYRGAVLPANLLQAQREYFGAHTYERVDKPRGEFFHTNWTGRGGTTSTMLYLHGCLSGVSRDTSKESL